MQVHVDAGVATIYSRNGLDWTNRVPIANAISEETRHRLGEAEASRNDRLFRHDG